MGRRSGGDRSGYVYVLANDAMPGLLKIGRTSRPPRVRARELSAATGVPGPFRVVHAVRVDDAVAVERGLHERLAGDRYRARREFFRLDERRAAALLDEAARRRGRIPRGVLRAVLAAAAAAAVLAWFRGQGGFAPGTAAVAAAAAAILVLASSRPRRRSLRRR